MRLAGRVAIITGAGRGIGKGIALSLAKEGCSVVVDDLDLTRANNLADEMKSFGYQALAIRADVTKTQEVQEMVSLTLEKFGRIDILVNNAGGSARAGASPFYQSSEETWDYVIALNLKGVLICTKAVLNHMIGRKSGKIIIIASIDGIVGNEGYVDYSSAKGGAITFTKALAKEVGPFGINVNSISPGLIDTPSISYITPDVLKQMQQKIILGRLGKPDDIGSAVTFLASDEAGWITGCNLIVSGGRLIV